MLFPARRSVTAMAGAHSGMRSLTAKVEVIIPYRSRSILSIPTVQGSARWPTRGTIVPMETPGDRIPAATSSGVVRAYVSRGSYASYQVNPEHGLADHPACPPTCRSLANIDTPSGRGSASRPRGTGRPTCAVLSSSRSRDFESFSGKRNSQISDCTNRESRDREYLTRKLAR